MSSGISCGVGGRKLVWHNGQGASPGRSPAAVNRRWRPLGLVSPSGSDNGIVLTTTKMGIHTTAALMMTSKFRGIVTRQSSLAKLSADLLNN